MAPMKTFTKTMVLAVLLAASVTACKKKDGAGSGGGETGVAECDDYLAKMDACAKKMGDKGGEGVSKMAKMMRDSWKDDVKDAQKKSLMPEVCKDAVKDMKKSLPDCDWRAGAAPAAAAPAAAGAAPAAAGDLPAECTDYKAAVDALAKCDKLPQATRDALKQAYDQSATAWANIPAEGRAGLATSCKAAADAVKQSTAACN
jgi:hypothetical protein